MNIYGRIKLREISLLIFFILTILLSWQVKAYDYQNPAFSHSGSAINTFNQILLLNNFGIKIDRLTILKFLIFLILTIVYEEIFKHAGGPIGRHAGIVLSIILAIISIMYLPLGPIAGIISALGFIGMLILWLPLVLLLAWISFKADLKEIDVPHGTAEVIKGIAEFFLAKLLMGLSTSGFYLGNNISSRLLNHNLGYAGITGVLNFIFLLLLWHAILRTLFGIYNIMRFFITRSENKKPKKEPGDDNSSDKEKDEKIKSKFSEEIQEGIKEIGGKIHDIKIVKRSLEENNSKEKLKELLEKLTEDINTQTGIKSSLEKEAKNCTKCEEEYEKIKRKMEDTLNPLGNILNSLENQIREIEKNPSYDSKNLKQFIVNESDAIIILLTGELRQFASSFKELNK